MDAFTGSLARVLTVSCLALSLGGCEAGKVIGAGDASDIRPLDLQFPETIGDVVDRETPADDLLPDAVADLPPSDAVAETDVEPGELPASDADPVDTPADPLDDQAPADVPADAPLEDAPVDLLPDTTDVPADVGPDVPPPEATFAWDPWDRVERFRVEGPGLVPDPFIEATTQKDTNIFEAFGSEKPASGLYLLHSAEGWDQGDGQVVVLLHGAGTTADQSFAVPDVLSSRSLVKALTADGAHRVFAITFAHPFGDNGNQAIALASAISIVKARTGVAKVAVVAHSKGGLAAMAYLKGREAKWGVPYANDVDRVVFLGAPLGGMDWSFRHPNATWTAVTWSMPMPSVWDKVMEYGQWKDLTDVSIYCGAYTGLLQALWPWDKVHALSSFEQDWYTTYNGGNGFVSHSRGILAAITLGGNFLQDLKALPAPADVAVAAGAGGSSLVGTVPWETTGPADGMVFTDSALDLSAFETAGSPILGARTFNLSNHWELLYKDDPTAFVIEMLGKAR